MQNTLSLGRLLFGRWTFGGMPKSTIEVSEHMPNIFVWFEAKQLKTQLHQLMRFSHNPNQCLH